MNRDIINLQFKPEIYTIKVIPGFILISPFFLIPVPEYFRFTIDLFI